MLICNVELMNVNNFEYMIEKTRHNSAYGRNGAPHVQNSPIQSKSSPVVTGKEHDCPNGFL